MTSMWANDGVTALIGMAAMPVVLGVLMLASMPVIGLWKLSRKRPLLPRFPKLFKNVYGIYTEFWELLFVHILCVFLKGLALTTLNGEDEARRQLHQEIEAEIRNILDVKTFNDTTTNLKKTTSADETASDGTADTESDTGSDSHPTTEGVAFNNTSPAANNASPAASPNDYNLMITHSCRTIFYCFIDTLLEDAMQKKGERKIRICTPCIHFGSFYKLLQDMITKRGDKIEFYQIDLHKSDWSLQADTIDPVKVKECDLIFCQHFFGVPFVQDKLFELGHEYNIPILEDCVQSGSLYGSYKGHAYSDIVVWSGGLDKTPSCLGGGFGSFRNTPYGNHFYKRCYAKVATFKVETGTERLERLYGMIAHLMISKNTFNVIYAIQFVLYHAFHKDDGKDPKVHEIALAIRKDKSALAPFQHSVQKFCEQPSIYHLLSMRYGVKHKQQDYVRIAKTELENRNLMLSNIPARFHSSLFPWYTPKVLEAHAANGGICEFTWATAEPGRRDAMMNFLEETGMITVMNTTWEHDKSDPTITTGKHICDHIIYLPNLNECKEQDVILMSQMLTQWCQSEENGDDKTMSNKKLD